MAPLPKRKLSKGRRGRRRNSYANLSVTQTSTCPHCKASKLSHRVCPSCGK